MVSFVIPVRNDAARLERCLASIAANDYSPELIEIIVVDNGSTDGSAAVARRRGAVVLHGANCSVAALRNKGARAALGGILAFVDADHEIDRQWIATAMDVLSDPKVAATGAPYLTQPSANWVQQQYDGLRDRPVVRQDVSWLGSGNLAVKRAAFETVGGFNADLTACEDVDLCNRLIGAGYRIVADPGLRSIHFGDPRTLRAVFFGELWRGRDNIRVTMSGPKTLRNLRSAAIPVYQLAALATSAVALMLDWWALSVAVLLTAVAPALVRASIIWRRKLHRSIVGAMQALTVAIVFDAARAFALLARASHQTRRSA